jgi:hypothetical protein
LKFCLDLANIPLKLAFYTIKFITGYFRVTSGDKKGFLGTGFRTIFKHKQFRSSFYVKLGSAKVFSCQKGL